MELPEHTLSLLEAYRKSHATRVLTLFLCDLEGSTRQQDKLGNVEAAFWVKAYRTIVRDLLAYFDGKEVETAGDSFFIVFASPSDGIGFALRLQAGLRAARKSVDLLPAVRMGLHQGQVVVEQEDNPALGLNIYGLQISIASRVMDLAEGGQILCTRHVFDDARAILASDTLAGIGELGWMNHGPFRLKGVAEPYDVCEVGERQHVPLAKPKGSDKAQAVTSEDIITGWRPAQNAKLPMMNWILERKLGEGGFGEVWLAHDGTQPNRKSVFKFCTKRSKIPSLSREMGIFNRLTKDTGESLEEIAELRGAHDDGEPPYYIQMPYYSGGDLRHWIDEHGSGATRKTKLALALQMARSVACLHRAGVIHRDIKPANFLLDRPYHAEQGFHLRICDFGTGHESALAAVVSDEPLCGGGARFTVQSETLAQAAGTYLFIAPELILDADSRNEKASKLALQSADIYSLGVSLYQLFAGSTKQVPGVGLDGLNDAFLRKLVLDCLKQDPQSRLTIDGLIGRLEEQEGRDGQLDVKSQEARRLQETTAPGGTVKRTLGLGGGIDLVMMWIPPGTFQMGSPGGEESREDSEGPVHQVEIIPGFWMGKYAITLAQWRCVMGASPSRFTQDDNLPVEQVSWEDCQEFLNRLNTIIGIQNGFCPPSEAQWEYACRAGTYTAFSFGETLSTDEANYDGRTPYGNGVCGEYRKKTLPVGSFPANAWGLHEMHGNVWEFCQDYYVPDFYTADPVTNPLCTVLSEERTVRGGAWYLSASDCRAAYRQGFNPTGRNDGIGLRVISMTSL